MSWWELGEHSGYSGAQLATYDIECAFCGERGNFETEHHAEKKKPNDRKILNFDTLKCGNCSGYVLVMWSTNAWAGSTHGIHDFRLVPWPQTVGEGREHWPDTVKRYWRQAHTTLSAEDYDAAAVMARSALQAVMRDKKATGKDLYSEIENLAGQGIIPPIVQEWSHEVRQLAKPAAHPSADEEPTSSKDAHDIVKFLDFLLEYLYDLPKQIQDYRELLRKNLTNILSETVSSRISTVRSWHSCNVPMKNTM